MLKTKKDNFITLKEAAEISGYSPDYLGQLIRGGKLEGQQVYMNTAWVTTKEAVQKYVQSSKGSQTALLSKPSFSDRLKNNWKKWSQWILYSVIGVNIVFMMFLFFLTSIAIEKRFEQKDLEERIQQKVVIPAVYGSISE